MYKPQKIHHRCNDTGKPPLVFSNEHGGEEVLDTYDKVVKLFKRVKLKKRPYESRDIRDSNYYFSWHISVFIAINSDVDNALRPRCIVVYVPKRGEQVRTSRVYKQRKKKIHCKFR